MMLRVDATLWLLLFFTASCTTPAPWAPAHPQLLTRWRPSFRPSTRIRSTRALMLTARAWDSPPRAALALHNRRRVSLNGSMILPRGSLSPPPPVAMPQRILVPYPFESTISGIRSRPSTVTCSPGAISLYLWSVDHTRDIKALMTRPGPGQEQGQGRVVARLFRAYPAQVRSRYWQSTLYIDGVQVGNHSGGYDGFKLDVTSHARGKPVEIVKGVDPTEKGSQPHGKQYAAAFAAGSATSKYMSIRHPGHCRARIRPKGVS